jgi:hypothetical protein
LRIVIVLFFVDPKVAHDVEQNLLLFAMDGITPNSLWQYSQLSFAFGTSILGRFSRIFSDVYLPQQFLEQNIPRGDLVVIGKTLPHLLQVPFPRSLRLLSLSRSLSLYAHRWEQ